MELPLHTLPKAERLSGKTDIGRLLGEGRYLSIVPCLRVCYRPDSSLPASRILVSVPKKHFKRAVKRNLLKRRIRESYRLQKELLAVPCDLMFIYTPKEILPSATVFAAVAEALRAVGKAAAR